MKDAQKPDHISLNTLIGRLKEGRFVIPDFQRDFEWEPWDIRDLIRSIFLDYYIGSLLLWKGKAENYDALSCEPIFAVDLHKMKIDAGIIEMDEKVDKFRKNKADGSSRLQGAWSDLDLVSRARKVGMSEDLITVAYRSPNTRVHSSFSEVLAQLEFEENGSISPVVGSSPGERKRADLAFNVSVELLRLATGLLIERFELVRSQAIDEFFQGFTQSVIGQSPN